MKTYMAFKDSSPITKWPKTIFGENLIKKQIFVFLVQQIIISVNKLYAYSSNIDIVKYAFNISINTLEVAILKVLVIWMSLAITLKKFYNHLNVSRTKHLVFVQRFQGGSTNSKIPHLMMMD